MSEEEVMFKIIEYIDKNDLYKNNLKHNLHRSELKGKNIQLDDKLLRLLTLSILPNTTLNSSSIVLTTILPLLML